jgi:hypothetical protein
MPKNFLYFLLLLTTRLFPQDSTLISKIKEEANLKSSYFLNLIPDGKEKDYGISARSDFSRVKTEEPYQTFYLSCKGQSCSLVPGNEWRVPLSVDGNYVALLTIQMDAKSGHPEAVDFGANLLAQKFQEFEKGHAREIIRHIVIRNTILNRDYIMTDLSDMVSKSKSGKMNTESNETLFINPASVIPVYLINKDLPAKTTLSEIERESLKVLNAAGNK